MDTQAQAAGLPGAQSAANSDDRVWAALAHASSMLMFLGPIVPLIMWVTQRKKSAYASFHALQALVYQALFFWLWIIIGPILAIIVMIIAIAIVMMTYPQSADQPFAVFGLQIAVFAVVFGGMLLFMGVGLVGAAACLMGREFRYPFFGGRLARYLEYQGPDQAELSEAKQDYIVASVSHSTCVVTLWGLITPLIAWLTQHDRSPFLRFQALQAAIYQVLGAVAYFGFVALDMFFVFGMMGAALVLGSNSSGAASGLFAILVILMMGILCVFVLAFPLYHLFGFLASLATLRGRDYRYPVLGKLLARRMNITEAK